MGPVVKLLIVGITGSLGSQFKSKVCFDSGSLDELIAVSHSHEFSVSIDSRSFYLDITCVKHLEKLFDMHPDITNIVFTPELRFIFSLLDFLKFNSFSPRIVCFSSQAVHTTIPYSKNKEWRILAENLAQNYPLDIIILRLNMVFGHAGDRNISLMQRCLKRWPILPVIVSNIFKSALISPVFIDDLVDCIYNICNSQLKAGIYDISGFSAISTLNFMRLSLTLNRTYSLLVPVPIVFIEISLIPFFFFRINSFLRLFEFCHRFIEDKSLKTSSILLRNRLYNPTNYNVSLVTSFLRSI